MTDAPLSLFDGAIERKAFLALQALIPDGAPRSTQRAILYILLTRMEAHYSCPSCGLLGDRQPLHESHCLFEPFMEDLSRMVIRPQSETRREE